MLDALLPELLLRPLTAAIQHHYEMQLYHCFKSSFDFSLQIGCALTKPYSQCTKATSEIKITFYVLLIYHSCCELNHKIKKTTV